MEELQGDIDSDFLLKGIKNGFDIIDPNSTLQPAYMENYKSAICLSNRPLVEKQIRQEILEGRYVIVSEKPTIVSALGAIKKSDSDIRLIHDCSQPAGKALNDYAGECEKLRYETVQDAAALLSMDSYLAKVDLKSAYRSVKLSESSTRATGLVWRFEGESKDTYIMDTALPFGSKLGPYIFTKLTQAVKRMMKKRGFNVLVYLDDFLIMEDSKEKCTEGLNILLRLLRKLGFAISYNKIVMPTKKLCFLGINICANTLTLELPHEKLTAFYELCVSFQGRKRASLRQLQELAGKLNWASQVVSGGRTYLRRVLDLMKPLKQPHHKVLLSIGFKEDIQWWMSYMHRFNAKRLALYHGPVLQVELDACNAGAGYAFAGDWGYTVWKLDSPCISSMHINDKEIMAGVLATRRWAHLWKHSLVIFNTDNMTARAAFDKGTARSEAAMVMVRELFWWSAIYDFKIVGIHVPGIKNVLPDTISRLHQPGYIQWLASLLGLSGSPMTFCSSLPVHMSFNAWSSIFPQIQKFWENWMN